MNTTAANYLLGPRGAWARTAVSVWCLVVSIAVFFVSPGPGVSGAWLALVLAWGAVTVSAHRRARARPAASISAPKAGVLAEDARTGRRHAVKYGLSVDPWSQLEAFWSVAGDLPLTIDPVTTTGGDDGFAVEWRNAMLAPLDQDAAPFDLDAFIARTAERYTCDRRKLGEEAARRWMTHEIDTHQHEIDAEFARRDGPRPVENLCRNCGQRVGWISRSQRCKPCTELSKRAWSMPSGSLADLATRTGSTVEIKNGAGETLAVHPSVERWESLTYQVRNVEQVRCTWRLQGTAEDNHAIHALRAAGVKVTLINEYPMSKTCPNVAELEGAQSAINQAHATYMRGLRERTAAGKVTG